MMTERQRLVILRRVAELKSRQAAEAQQSGADLQTKIGDIQGATSSGGIASAVGDTISNVGKGAVSSAARIGSNVLGGVGLGQFDTTNEMYRRGHEAANALDKDTGVPGFIGGMAVDAAGTAGMNIPRKVFGGVGRALPRVTDLLRSTAAGAGQGAAVSADPSLGAAAVGGLGGFGGRLASQVGGTLTRGAGRTESPQLKAFEDKGIDLTVGQAANPNTPFGATVRRSEEAMKLIPFLGSGIANRRNAATNAWRDSLLRDVAEKGGLGPVPKIRDPKSTTSSITDRLRGELSSRYSAALRGKTLPPTDQLRKNLKNIADDPILALTKVQRKALKTDFNRHILEPVSNSKGQTVRNWDLPTLWKHQSKLRSSGKRIAKRDEDLGAARIQAADEILDFIERGDPATGAVLKQLSQPFAQLNTLRTASKLAGVGGEFTPAQLLKIAGKTRGASNLAKEAESAGKLLTDQTGSAVYLKNITPQNAATIAGLAGAGATAPMASIAGLGAYSTKFGQDALMGRLGIQRKIAKKLADQGFAEKLARAMSTAGATAGSGLLNKSLEEEDAKK